MRAVLFERSGSTSGLVLREVPDPTPAAGEVLVRIHATTVTQGDVVLRKMPQCWRACSGSVASGCWVMSMPAWSRQSANACPATAPGTACSVRRRGSRWVRTRRPPASLETGPRRDPERVPVRRGRPDPDRVADSADPDPTRGRRRWRGTADPCLRRVRQRGQLCSPTRRGVRCPRDRGDQHGQPGPRAVTGRGARDRLHARGRPDHPGPVRRDR